MFFDGISFFPSEEEEEDLGWLVYRVSALKITYKINSNPLVMAKIQYIHSQPPLRATKPMMKGPSAGPRVTMALDIGNVSSSHLLPDFCRKRTFRCSFNAPFMLIIHLYHDRRSESNRGAEKDTPKDTTD